MWETKFLVPNIKAEEQQVSKRLYTAIALLSENGLDFSTVSNNDIVQTITNVDLKENKDLLIKLRTSLHELKSRFPEVKEVTKNTKYPSKKDSFYVPEEYLENIFFIKVDSEKIEEETVIVPQLESEIEVLATQQQIDLGLVKPEMDIDIVIDFLKGLKQMTKENTPDQIEKRIEILKMDLSLLEFEYKQLQDLLLERDTLQQAITSKNRIQGDVLQ